MQNSNYQIAPPFDEFNGQQPPTSNAQQMQMNGGPPSGQPPQRLTPQQRMPPMSGPNQQMHPNYNGPMMPQNGQMMQANYNGPMGGGGGQMPPHNGQMMGMQNSQPMNMNGPNSYNQPPQMMQQLGNMNLPPGQQQMKMMGMNSGGKIYAPGQAPPDCLNAQLGPGMDKNGNLANGGDFSVQLESICFGVTNASAYGFVCIKLSSNLRNRSILLYQLERTAALLLSGL